MAALAMTDMIRERIRQERNGVSLPDSTEVLNCLRENHFRVTKICVDASLILKLFLDERENDKVRFRT
jgi:hypothetical protein